MTNVKDIVSYAKSNARNKIVLCETCIDGLHYTDVGREMSTLLGETPDVLSGKETMCRQVMGESCHDEAIGRYLAIKNIGILFEEDLHLNLQSIFETYSKSQTLIVCAAGEVKNDIFRYYNSDRYAISLKGLSYKTI